MYRSDGVPRPRIRSFDESMALLRTDLANLRSWYSGPAGLLFGLTEKERNRLRDYSGRLMHLSGAAAMARSDGITFISSEAEAEVNRLALDAIILFGESQNLFADRLRSRFERE